MADSFARPYRRSAPPGLSPLQTLFTSSSIQGAVLAAACVAVYIALRPPLFDFDGYMYRLYALLPNRFDNVNPHHLLWNSVQIALAGVTRIIGRPTTVPFQIFGILVNCTTLFFLYLLLIDTEISRFFAAAAVIFVAFSPAFWYLGLQNHPYTAVFLAVVLYLHCWNPAQAEMPLRSRFLAAATLTVAVLFHQAVFLLVPVAVIVLILFDRRTLATRVVAGLAWGAGVSGLVIGAYFCFWRYVAPGVGLLRWSNGYMESVHPIQLFQLGFIKSFGRSVMGFSSALLQDESIQEFLELHLRTGTILIIYTVLGILALGCFGMAVLRTQTRRALVELARNNSLFLVSFLSLLAWCAFAFSWEAATAHYWALSLFPALVCVGFLLRKSGPQPMNLTITGLILASAWNVYFNVLCDRNLSRNFPEPLVTSIEHFVGPRDKFIVLGDHEWFGSVNYILLFNCLTLSGKDRGIAILDDYVVPDRTHSSWPGRLRQKINSVLDSGGHVFVADHVFEHESYLDLSLADDPFNEQINTQYLGIGPAEEQEIRQVFANYTLERSALQLGSDFYFTVRPIRPGVPAPLG